MKILSSIQMREADAFTIQNEPIGSYELMQRAASACSDWILNEFSENDITVVCGTGNNGGDGLCIARKLHAVGKKINLIILSGKHSDDFDKALADTNAEGIESLVIVKGEKMPEINSPVIIDAIFGTGLTRPVSGWLAECIEAINQAQGKIIAVDLPSGLFSDDHTGGVSICADYTLTFHSPKLAFMFAENAERVGEFTVLDIGLDKQFASTMNAPEYFSRAEAVIILKPRRRFSHKGDYGKSFLMAGSHGKMGAAVMAAKACLRTGAGLLTVYIPRCGYDIMQTSLPEAMCITGPEEDFISPPVTFDSFDVVGAGPGIGRNKETAKAVQQLLTECMVPAVLDADALNILSDDNGALKKLSPRFILTPHPGEFERLAGESSNEFDRHRLQRKFCDEFNVIVVLKGAHTCTMIPHGKTYFNSSGNPGMAKGGTGDALTGIILGLLSQKYTPEESAVLGVYLHGLAGDYASVQSSEYSMLSTDLIESLPTAFKYLQ